MGTFISSGNVRSRKVSGELLAGGGRYHPLAAGIAVARWLQPGQRYWPAQHQFEQIASTRDILGRAAPRRKARSRDLQPSVVLLDAKLLNPSVALRIERVCESQDRCQIQDEFLLVEGKLLQCRMARLGQRAAMKTRDRGGQAQVRRAPSQRRRDPPNHSIGSLVVSFVMLRAADIMHQRGGPQN